MDSMVSPSRIVEATRRSLGCALAAWVALSNFAACDAGDRLPPEPSAIGAAASALSGDACNAPTAVATHLAYAGFLAAHCGGSLIAPSVNPRGAEEAEAAYLARLASLDGTLLPFAYALDWSDLAGHGYGTQTAALESVLQLPRFTFTLEGPTLASPSELVI